MKLLLVRHGETDWNKKSWIQGRTDTCLNENGERQARSLGERLLKEEISIARIYTSRLKRAGQTAQIVSEMVHVPWEVEEGLEEMNLGAWEGQTWKHVREEFSEEYRRWYENRRYTRIPGGESYQDLLDRLVPALRRIQEKSGGDVLVVTHSACIMTLLSYLKETPFEDMYRNYRLNNAQFCVLEEKELLAAYEADYACGAAG